jgi:cytosine/uracil/thiamine/allantoin permease
MIRSQVVNQLRADTTLSLYVSFPIMVAAGIGSWLTLSLGFADLSRYSRQSVNVRKAAWMVS